MDPPRLHHHHHLLILGEKSHENRVGGLSYSAINHRTTHPPLRITHPRLARLYVLPTPFSMACSVQHARRVLPVIIFVKTNQEFGGA